MTRCPYLAQGVSSAFTAWLASWGGASATDNCSSVSWSNNSNGIAPSCCSSVTVVFTASDVCGNTSTTSATFVVGTGGGNLKLTKQASNDTISCGSSINGQITTCLSNHVGAGATDTVLINWTNNFSSLSSNCDTSSSCTGFRTETMGGWGAPPHGGNPAAFMYANFASAFPGGITIGCAGGFTDLFDGAVNITNFLPSGGMPATLTSSQVDPTGPGNTLAGQELAVALAIGFDNSIPGFSKNHSFHLQDLIINSGPLQRLDGIAGI